MAAITIPDLHSIPATSSRRPVLRVVADGERAHGRRRAAAVYRRRRLVALFVACLAVPATLLGVRGAADALAAGPLSGRDGAPVLLEAGDGPAVAAQAEPAGAPAPAEYVVQPGDTLWSIAERVDRDGDLRTVVDALADAAGGASLRVGQRIVLPG